LTSGPSGEPTIDIHGGDRPPPSSSEPKTKPDDDTHDDNR
jgi:hypothetical protein